MSDASKKIIIDEDWKSEAQQEKEMLEEKLEQEKLQQGKSMPQASFEVLVNSLAMPAMLNLGLIHVPQQKPQINLAEAQFYIDLLTVVENKTKGNLETAEHNLLKTILYELRMAFVNLSQSIDKQGTQTST
ncbi:MAG: DUF1844 domain-containing protein [Planctomycetia bacterium]|nr:DUF1844 domain-containing protein [Planctomycetia bacterium]